MTLMLISIAYRGKPQQNISYARRTPASSSDTIGKPLENPKAKLCLLYHLIMGRKAKAENPKSAAQESKSFHPPCPT